MDINIEVLQDTHNSYTNGLCVNLAQLENGEIAITLEQDRRVIVVKGDDLLKAIKLLQEK